MAEKAVLTCRVDCIEQAGGTGSTTGTAARKGLPAGGSRCRCPPAAFSQFPPDQDLRNELTCRLEIEAQEQALEQMEKRLQEAIRTAHEAEQRARAASDTLKAHPKPSSCNACVVARFSAGLNMTSNFAVTS